MDDAKAMELVRRFNVTTDKKRKRVYLKSHLANIVMNTQQGTHIQQLICRMVFL